MKALIFDVDGTLVDSESLHREAFNAAFADVGLGWYWDEVLYGHLLGVAGGKERIRHYWRCVEPDGMGARPAEHLIDRIHALKTAHYTRRVRAGALALRPGIAALIDEASQAALPLAIATTTTPDNVEALLATTLGVHWRERFVAVCDASSAAAKKPAPDVYRAALRCLGVPAASCLALEDSALGLRAAVAAGVPTVITTNAYTATQCFDGALCVLAGLDDASRSRTDLALSESAGLIGLAALRRIHAADGVTPLTMRLASRRESAHGSYRA